MKKITLIGILALVFSVFTTTANAKNFPERPIEIVVPFGPGGTTDVYARAFARVLPNYLPNKQRVVIVNKPGGASTIGMTSVAIAKPDGYTIAILPTGAIESQPHFGRTKWDLSDFVGVMGFLEIPASINVHKSSPIKDYDDLIEFIKQNPGKFTYSTSGGTGSDTHLAMVNFARTSGLKIRNIPFEGQAEGTSAVMSGQVMGSYAMPDIHNGGEIRPLVFLSKTKPTHEVYDDIPFSTDVGLDITSQFAMGVVAPKNTPADRIKVLHDAFKEALNDPEIVKFFNTNNMEQVYRSSEDLTAEMHQRSKVTKELLLELKLIKK